MRTRAHYAAFLVCLALPILAGCGRNIVRAASPSVTSPPPSPPQPSASSTAAAAAAEPIPAPELPQPAPELAPVTSAAPQPPRPRPAAPVAAEPEAARPRPEVAAPQISPALTPADEQRLTRLATDQIRTAERNMQLAANRRLNPVQNDLADKVRGFLSQAHEAIRVNDWVRAQNLAEKAQVLSADLVKSL
jgi:hypothetical protein